MKRKYVKMMTDIRKKKIINEKIKNIKKTINSNIYIASSNGNYKVRIQDEELGECEWYYKDKIKEALKITEQLKEYYENKGFDFEIKYIGVQKCLDISWKDINTK